MDFIYSDAYLDWQLGRDHPTDPRRAERALTLLQDQGVVGEALAPRVATMDELAIVHDGDYLDQLAEGRSGEWEGVQPNLFATARLMAGGTMLAVDRLLDGTSHQAFNPMGAKHHAGRSRSSGYCVINDMAMAAHRLVKAGLRVLYVDWDAHHGDGVEDLTRHLPGVMTASVHGHPMFPGTGAQHDEGHDAFNYPLGLYADGSDLLAAVDDALERAVDFGPDVLLAAARADGHIDDPLSFLDYETASIVEVAHRVADFAALHCEGRMIVGGACGYRPLDTTPAVWAAVFEAMVR